MTFVGGERGPGRACCRSASITDIERPNAPILTADDDGVRDWSPSAARRGRPSWHALDVDDRSRRHRGDGAHAPRMGRVLPVWQSWTTTAHRGRVYQPIRDVIHRIHRPDEPAGSFADPVSATAHVLNPAPDDVPTWAPDRAPIRDTRIVGALNDAVGAERGVLDLHPCRRTDSGRAHLHLHHDGDRGAPSGRNDDDQIESRVNNDHPRWHGGAIGLLGSCRWPHRGRYPGWLTHHKGRSTVPPRGTGRLW